MSVGREHDFIVVGAGLGGLVAAKELSRRGKRVLVLERGGRVDRVGTIMRIAAAYDAFGLARSAQGTIICRAFGIGGTGIISCGNAVEFDKEYYGRIGLGDADILDEAKRETGVRAAGMPIGRASEAIMRAANSLGLDMRPMPKFTTGKACVSCGECVSGCAYGAKWTSRECLRQLGSGAVEVRTGVRVSKVVKRGGRAVAVEGRGPGGARRTFYGERIILAAGGLGTPVILQHSGIDAGDGLFVDLFNETYGIAPGFCQRRERAMSVVCDTFYRTDRFVLSPFVDNCAGFIPGVAARHIPKVLRLGRVMGIMTKIADDNCGKVRRDGRVDKAPTGGDLEKLRKGSAMARDILQKCGVRPGTICVTRPRGAHPGGTAAIGKVVDMDLRTAMKGLYVCDASVLPSAPGLPPMLTLIALAMKFARSVS